MRQLQDAAGRAGDAMAEIRVPDLEHLVGRARRRRIRRRAAAGFTVIALIALGAAGLSSIGSPPREHGVAVVAPDIDHDDPDETARTASLPVVRDECSESLGACVAGFEFGGVRYDASCGRLDAAFVAREPIAVWETSVGETFEVREVTADPSRTLLAYRAGPTAGCDDRTIPSEWAFLSDASAPISEVHELLCPISIPREPLYCAG